MNQFSIRLLRYSFAFLFLWFGVQQILHPASWVFFLPEWTGYVPIPGEMLIQLNGWFEIIASLFLFIGIYTRVIAFVLSIHLFGIALSAGGAIGIRDSVLAMAGISLSTTKVDSWTIDARTTT